MATVGDGVLTLRDWAARLDPDGSVAAMANILAQRNMVVSELPFIEGNLPTGHQFSVVSALPSASWRELNEGVAISAGTSKIVTETCGMLRSWGQIDEDIAVLNGNTAEFRMSEDRLKIEALNQEFVGTLIYGNSGTAPEEFTGLQPRYDSLTTGSTASYVLDAGGTGSTNSSVYLVVAGPDSVAGIFPKGQSAGLQVNDLGLETVYDANSNPFRAYMTEYKWNCGLMVKDYRQVCRIANIDVSLLKKDAATGADLIEKMIVAMHTVWDVSMGKPMFLANNTVMSFLDLQTLNQSNINVSYTDDPHGRKVMTFRGIPVLRTDQLLSTEDTIS